MNLSAGRVAESAFRALGIQALQELGGPFSAVLWNGAERRLIAFADRLGWHRPVFVERKRRLAVGWRIVPLLSALDLRPEPDEASLIHFLLTSTPVPGGTYLRHVHGLEPGQCLEASPRDVRRWTYWQPEVRAGAIGEGEAAAAVVETLDRVVAQTVPGRGFALTLSSGLDSASVAAALRKRDPDGDVMAVTWVAPELPGADEGPAAAEVTRYLGLTTEELRVDRLWPLSSPQGMATDAETPFRPPFREAWEATFRRASELGWKGIVTGAGGDLLFGYCGPGCYGYPDLLMTGRWWELARQLVRHDAVSDASMLRILDRELVRPLLRPAIRAARGSRAHRNVAPWLHPRLHRRSADVLRPERIPGVALPGRRHRLRVLRDRFQPFVLQALGRMASEAGVEVRHPLVDHRLWELAARLPSTATYSAGYHKVVLRRGLVDRLPRNCLQRRLKIHVAPVFERGLRERETETVWGLLTDMRAADLELVDEAAVRSSYQAYLDGGTASRFWYVLCVEDWLRRHF